MWPRSGAQPRSLLWVVVLATVTGLLLPVVLLGAVVMGVVEPRLAAREQQQELDHKLDLLATSLTEVLWNLEKPGVASVVTAVMASPNVVRVQVRESALPGDFYAQALPQRALGQQYAGERDVLRNGVKIGQVRIEIDDHLEAVLQRNHRLLYVGTALVQLLVALLLVVGLLHTQVIRPLRKLGHFAKQIARGNFSAPLVQAQVREIGQLADHMAYMRGAVQAQFEAAAEQERMLKQTAHYDALTGLPNRVLMADRLEHAMHQTPRRHASLAVAFLDLDGFKTVNDNHGHETGDLLLRTLAQRMKAVLRDGDTLARYGGDEFVAVLGDLHGPQDCEPLLVRLLDAAAAPVQAGQTVLQVSISIGVAFFDPTDRYDAEQLLRRADQAMYVAKNAGKNRYHLFTGMETVV